MRPHCRHVRCSLEVRRSFDLDVGFWRYILSERKKSIQLKRRGQLETYKMLSGIDSVDILFSVSNLGIGIASCVVALSSTHVVDDVTHASPKYSFPDLTTMSYFEVIRCLRLILVRSACHIRFIYNHIRIHSQFANSFIC